MMSIAGDITDAASKAALKQRVGRRLVVLASLALIVLAAASSLIMVQGIDRQITDVLHTYEMRSQARQLTIALIEAESSQRGFVLTHDESYLEPYRSAAAGIEARMVSLSALTEGDPAQAERIGEIGSAIVTKMAEMARTVDLVQSQRSGEARSLIQTGMGARLMGEVHDTLDQFITQEDQRLLERNQAIEGTRRMLVVAMVAALAGAVMLGYSLFARTQQEVNLLARSQNLLLSENEILEEHVQERTRAVQEARDHAERERQRVEALLQDTNHRIGNSLATVSSLLGLQLMRSKSDEVRQALEAARSRVHAIASAHRRLRLGSDLETASADEFLDAVLEDLANTVSDKKVKLAGQIDPIVISARDATTIGILVSELVTNALKHAFPEGRSGTITVILKRDAAGVPTLCVSDDGVGIAADRQSGEGGLGSVIIKQLSNQFGGVPDYARPDRGGLAVSVPLPGLDKSSPVVD